MLPCSFHFMACMLSYMPACMSACCTLQLESVLNGLEERLRQYHACCHRLALLPATAKRAAGITYEMGVNRAATTPQELISGDLKVGVADG